MFDSNDKASPKPYEGPRTASGIVEFAESLKPIAAAPITQLKGSDVIESECTKRRVCIVAFLPHIMDTGAAGRNEYLAILERLSDKHKRSGFGWVWSEALAQPQLEHAVGVGGSGYPAIVALAAAKGKFSPMRGTLDEGRVSTFVAGMMSGREAAYDASNWPAAIQTVPAWDGLDPEGYVPEEPVVLDEL